MNTRTMYQDTHLYCMGAASHVQTFTQAEGHVDRVSRGTITVVSQVEKKSNFWSDKKDLISSAYLQAVQPENLKCPVTTEEVSFRNQSIRMYQVVL